MIDPTLVPGPIPTPPVHTTSFVLDITNERLAERTRQNLVIGHKFVFEAPAKRGRIASLLTGPTTAPVVWPMVGTVELEGLRVIPATTPAEPLHALVCDRDVYRAEEDTVHLFVAMPDVPAQTTLRVSYAGDTFTTVDLSASDALRTDGMHIEALSMLLPGAYSAQIHVDGRAIGQATRFTVAAYTLAPLTGRLMEHALEAGSLSFTLEVESYELAFDQPLQVALLSGDDVQAEVELTASAPGLYFGSLPVSGDDALRLRLVARDDAERTCEVVLPGSRKHERVQTCISTLGTSHHLALMPAPDALPVRGAYITRGDVHASPVVTDEVVTREGLLTLRADVQSLCVLSTPLGQGTPTVVHHGDLSAGDTVKVPVTAAMTTMHVAGFVAGKPWEAYAHFILPAELAVEVNTAHNAADKTLAVTLNVDSAGRVARDGSREKTTRGHTVLLSVRDTRLTQTDTPEVALSASIKRAIDAEVGTKIGLAVLRDDDAWAWTRLGARPVDLRAVKPDEALLGTVDRYTAEQFLLFPLRRVGSAVEVAVARSIDPFMLDHVQRALGCDALILRWAPKADVRAAIQAHMRHMADPMLVGAVQFSAPMPRGGGMAAFGGGGDTFDDLDQESGVPPDLDMLMESSMPPPVPAAAPLPSPALPSPAQPPMTQPSAAQPSMAPPLARRKRAAAPMAELAADASAEEFASEGMTDARTPLMDHESAGERARGEMDAHAPDGPPAGGKEAAAPALPTHRPEQLFFGLVHVQGETTIEVPLADAVGTFTVEAFALEGADWCRVHTTAVIELPARAALDLPPMIFPGDDVTCTLFAQCCSGQGTVELTCDGAPVALRREDTTGQDADAGPQALPARFTFKAGPGTYEARVTDVETGAVDTEVVLVGTPGALRSMAKEVGFIEAGQTLTMENAGEDVRALRVLPGLTETTAGVLSATADYGHLCCEQTAAKIVAAVGMYLGADDAVVKTKAESIIVAGVRREKTMWVKGKGLRMYPTCKSVNTYWGKLAVPYLWQLAALADVPGISTALRDAAMDGVAIADDVGPAYGVERMPGTIADAAGAYRVALHDAARLSEAADWVKTRLTQAADGTWLLGKAHGAAASLGLSDGSLPGPGLLPGRVLGRAEQSYAAAVLLMAGALKPGISLANTVLRQLGSQGRLYSTVDSVAACAMLGALKTAGVGEGCTVRVNGVQMSLADAVALGDRVETLEVLRGVCAVELEAVRTERWADFKLDFGLTVGLRGPNGAPKTRFAQGDRALLSVTLDDGYKAGDLVHVALPAALSWLKGGGRVQQFTVDFEGKDAIEVPLLVTGRLAGAQHFAVCVRNMFEEERAANPGLLVVQP